MSREESFTPDEQSPPPEPTRAEKSAAWQWLREFALSTQPEARNAYVALREWTELKRDNAILSEAVGLTQSETASSAESPQQTISVGALYSREDQLADNLRQAMALLQASESVLRRSLTHGLLRTEAEVLVRAIAYHALKNAAPQVPHGVCRADDPNPEAPESRMALQRSDKAVAPAARPGEAIGVAPSVSDDSAGTGIPVDAALVEQFRKNLAASEPDLKAKLKPYEDGERASRGLPFDKVERANTAERQDRIDELEAVLHELITLKDMHDEVERLMPRDLSAPRNYRAEELDDDYKRRKPLAWKAARDALVGTSLRSASASFKPTHKHAEGGLYEVLGQIRLKTEFGWRPAVLYRNAEGMQFCRTEQEFGARFIPASPPDSSKAK